MPLAFASSAATSAVNEPSVFANMIPLLMILVVFYFLIIRPQQNKMREHQRIVSQLKPGDTVVMGSGIIGTIVSAKVESEEAVLEIAKDVHIKIRKDMVNEIIPATSSKHEEKAKVSKQEVKEKAKPAKSKAKK